MLDSLNRNSEGCSCLGVYCTCIHTRMSCFLLTQSGSVLVSDGAQPIMHTMPLDALHPPPAKASASQSQGRTPDHARRSRRSYVMQCLMHENIVALSICLSQRSAINLGTEPSLRSPSSDAAKSRHQRSLLARAR